MKKRNGMIDLWRFIFAFCLVVFHMWPDGDGLPIIFRGQLAVEFFF